MAILNSSKAEVIIFISISHVASHLTELVKSHAKSLTVIFDSVLRPDNHTSTVIIVLL